MNILLIDDESGVLRALQLLLQAIGHNAETFSNGGEALLRLEEKGDHFELILCDLRMAPLSGFDVLRALKERNNRVPCVLISAHATQADIQKGRELGACDFLSKPFSPAEFNELLARLEANGLVSSNMDVGKAGNS